MLTIMTSIMTNKKYDYNEILSQLDSIRSIILDLKMKDELGLESSNPFQRGSMRHYVFGAILELERSGLSLDKITDHTQILEYLPTVYDEYKVKYTIKPTFSSMLRFRKGEKVSGINGKYDRLSEGEQYRRRSKCERSPRKSKVSN